MEAAAREERSPVSQPPLGGRSSAVADCRMTRRCLEVRSITRSGLTIEVKTFIQEVVTAIKGPLISESIRPTALVDSAPRTNMLPEKEAAATKEGTAAPITILTTSILSKWNYKTCSSPATKTIPTQDTRLSTDRTIFII